MNNDQNKRMEEYQLLFVSYVTRRTEYDSAQVNNSVNPTILNLLKEN